MYMKDLKYFQNIIKEKRKKTEFRDYLKQIMSYYTFNIYQKNWLITPFCPHSNYNIVTPAVFEEIRSNYYDFWIDYSWDFWKDFMRIAQNISYPCISSWWNNQNSKYAHKVMYWNNCYLSFEVCDSDTVLYSVNVKDYCKNIYNWMMIWDHSENIYQSIWIYQSSFVFYSKFIFNSSDIWLSTNLVWCHECISCEFLENKTYCIKNKQYSKDEYYKLKSEILSQKDKFNEIFLNLNLWTWQLISKNSDWKFLIKTNNVENWYFVYNINNWRNLIFAWVAEWNNNFYDSSSCWAPRWDNYYWVTWAWWWDNYYIWIEVIGWSDIYYSYYLENCSYCIWCVWLKNKSYCILNKEYTKEEWEKLAVKIFEQMEKDWTLWDFFPWKINPFYFNDTAAYLIDDSFTKQEIEKDWYMWRDEEVKVDIPEGADIVYSCKFGATSPLTRGELRGVLDTEIRGNINDYQWYDSNWNWQINPEILKKVIKDKNWNYYRIVKLEYDFLMKYELPIPENHWLDRIKMWFKF